MVPASEVEALEKSLQGTKVDWQVVTYSGAKHSFTNPNSDKTGMPGVGYNERADRRSWEQMKSLFKELFSRH